MSNHLHLSSSNNNDVEYAKGGLVAPNGKKSKLTPEQYKLVRTPAFKAWFGDWENDAENASKFLDENGEPLVFYRGGQGKLGDLGFEFKLGLNLLGKPKKNDFGFFFTDDKEIAARYSEFEYDTYGDINSFFLSSNRVLDLTDFGKKISQNDFVQGLIDKGISFENFEYLPNHIINYFRNGNTYLGWGDWTFDYFDVFPELRNVFLDNGYTSVIFEENSRSFYTYNVFVVFDSNQIKLADGSNTTFDANNPDIRYEQGGLIAPNGKPSNLTPEQYKLVRTPEFKTWFGDWENNPENASKVVDENGEPLVCIHSTNDIFYTFEEDKIATKHGKEFGKGFYFYAKEFSNDKYGKKKIEAFLNIRKPYLSYDYLTKEFYIKGARKKDYEVINDFKRERNRIINSSLSKNMRNKLWDKSYSDEIDYATSLLKKYKYDGVYTNFMGKIEEIVAFNPEQIKLADGSNTTFDADNPDIRYERGGITAFNDMIKSEWLNAWKVEYENDIARINEMVARQYLYQIALKNFGGVEEIEFVNQSKKPKNHFQMRMYLGELVLYTSPFIYVDDNHKVVQKRTKVELLNADYETINPDIRYDDGGKVNSTIPPIFSSTYDKVVNGEMDSDAAAIYLYEQGIEVDDVLYDKLRDAENTHRKKTMGLQVGDTITVKGKNGISDFKANFRGYTPEGKLIVVYDKGKQMAIGKDEYYATGGNLPVGKLAKGMTLDEVAALHGLTGEDLKGELQKGIETEMEHTDEPEYAKAIALDHLYENPYYYSKLAKIEAQYMKNGGQINPDAPEIKNAILHKSGSSGGLLVGNRHSEGGIKAINKSNGQHIEMEGGEVVITRNAVSDEKKREFEGEMLTNREILSRINQSGGGVAFADGGSVPDRCACSGKTYKYGGKTMTDYEIVEDMNMSENHRKRKALADKYASIEETSFKNGGALDGLTDITDFSDCALYFLATLWETGVSFLDYSAKKKGDLKPLEAANLIYITKSSSPDCVAAHLTDKGKRFLQMVNPSALYKKGGVLECGCGCGKLKEGGKIGEGQYTYFKGVDHKYKNQFQVNKAVEELLESKSPSEFSVEERNFLTYFTGYGGLEKYGAKGKGLKYEYYTPSIIARKMWGLAYKYGFKGGMVLEPSCGIGEFIKYAPNQSEVVGYETNPVSAKIANILYPQAKIVNNYFETIFIKNNDSIKDKISGLQKYSLVIGNPPYGTMEGIYAGMGEEKYANAENFIDYFILRGLDLLESGGLLIYIIGAEVAIGGDPFLAKTTLTKNKKMIAERAELIDAYRLPNGVFDFTDVLSDIVVFKKK